MKLFRTAQSAESVPGTPWSITDDVLDLLDAELAVPTPERGAALIGARDARVIVDAVVDPRPGERVSYWHSDALRTRLAEYLQGNPAYRYVGTVHSHPGGFAEPSGPDHRAFASTLDANPAVREAIFPIIVQQSRADLGNVLRLGERHLVDLPNGTLAGYSAHPAADGLVVRPAAMHIIPIGSHTRTVASVLTERFGDSVLAAAPQPLELGGTMWLAVHFTLVDEVVAGVAFGPSYPITPPMVWSAASSTPAFPEWPLAAAGEDLAAAVGGLLDRDRAASVDAGEIRAGIEARLAVHLPSRVGARVLLVGAGSVGSNAAEMLVRSGVRDLTIVDFDVVEPANLSRTVYDASALRRPKSEALADRLTAIAPDVVVTGITAPLQELTDEVLSRADLVFLASDDMAGEGWLNHRLYLAATPFVSVKLFAGAEGSELAFVVPDEDTACLRCMTGALGTGDRGEVDYGTGRIQGSPALGPDIVAATARGVKVALALTQPDGPLADWVQGLVARRLTYFLSSNVEGWKYTEFVHPGSRAFDGVWLTAPGQRDCEICGDDRADEVQPARVSEFATEPPSA
jgi:threonine dehydrogenase-like Zn-dependent dehydrogenase